MFLWREFIEKYLLNLVSICGIHSELLLLLTNIRGLACYLHLRLLIQSIVPAWMLHPRSISEVLALLLPGIRKLQILIFLKGKCLDKIIFTLWRVSKFSIDHRVQITLFSVNFKSEVCYACHLLNSYLFRRNSVPPGCVLFYVLPDLLYWKHI